MSISTCRRYASAQTAKATAAVSSCSRRRIASAARTTAARKSAKPTTPVSPSSCSARLCGSLVGRTKCARLMRCASSNDAAPLPSSGRSRNMSSDCLHQSRRASVLAQERRPAPCPQCAGRLSCASTDARLDWWRQSLDMFRDRPLEGSGAASFELAHRINRAHFVRPTSEPHNLALQLLGETGVVGFALFLAAVVLAALAMRRRLHEDTAAVAFAVCALAYLLHVLIDIDYDYVAVSAPLFVLLGALLARPGTTIARREPIWAGGALVLAAAAVLSLAAPVVAQHKVDRALATGDADLAEQAHLWDPVSIEPLEAEAIIEEARGKKLHALQLYHEAIDTQPDNPRGWVELGLFELQTMKDPCAAYRALNQAYTLDRFGYPEVAAKGGPLDVARAKVNAGACGTG